jgi:hypothetical protein
MSGKKITFADGTTMSTAGGTSSAELDNVKTLAIALG